MDEGVGLGTIDVARAARLFRHTPFGYLATSFFRVQHHLPRSVFRLPESLNP